MSQLHRCISANDVYSTRQESYNFNLHPVNLRDKQLLLIFLQLVQSRQKRLINQRKNHCALQHAKTTYIEDLGGVSIIKTKNIYLNGNIEWRANRVSNIYITILDLFWYKSRRIKQLQHVKRRQFQRMEPYF